MVAQSVDVCCYLQCFTGLIQARLKLFFVYVRSWITIFHQLYSTFAEVAMHLVCPLLWLMLQYLVEARAR